MATIPAKYVDTDTFTTSGAGDRTVELHAGRRIQAYCGVDGFRYGTILSSSYAAPINTVNLTADSQDLTSNLLAIKYGIVSDTPSGSLPVHDHSSDQGKGGLLDHGVLNGLADDDHTQYSKADGTRAFSGEVAGVTPTVDASLATKGYVDDAIETKVYTPYTITVSAGTWTAGTTASVATLADGETYDVDEVTGVPGFNVIFKIKNVPSFSRIWTNLYYDGSASHVVNVDLYNFDTDTWDTFGNFNGAMTTYVFFEFLALYDTDYIDTGNDNEVWVRFYHVQTGNVAHKIYWDYVAVALAGFGSAGSDHGNLAGLLDDDHTQYILKDGTRAFTAPVSGQDPTLDNHLATKSYTDSASANAYQQVINDDYMPVDASKAFTAPVSGQTPTEDAHLATKAYADSLGGSFTGLSDTPSGYSGEGLKLLRVNSGESAVEFVASDTITDPVSANALTQANAYTDTQIVSVSAAADEADNAVLASAQTYAESASANALTQAEAYTDTEVASVSAAADEGDNATLASAQTYAESASANAYAQAQTYSDAASANALVQSWVFDPTPDSDHEWSGEWTTMQVDANATGIGAALYMASDGNFEEADADASTTMPCKVLALEAGTGSKKVLFRGFMRDDTWNWTPGGLLYVSTTAGALTQTAPSGSGDQVQVVGFATHADRIFFNPDYTLVEVA